MSLIAKLTNLFVPPANTANAVAPVTVQTTTPISGNPFIGPNNSDSDVYGKNRPVPGGYFAGYHNGKPNIVGRKLFIMI